MPLFPFEILFIGSCALVVYPWIVYPLLLRCLPVRARNGVDSLNARRADAVPPSVTMVVCAHDEARWIGEKVRNALALDYPADRLGVVVVSDASTDATDSIVADLAAADARAALVRMHERGGKTRALNRVVPGLSSDLVVFTDANAMFEPRALRELVAPFEDPQVGYTVGAALYRDEDAEAVNVSEGLYWRYEMLIKRLESRFDSVVGGDGAIYAIRRELYRPLADVDISDFVNPLQIVADGHRGVFVPEARSHESGSDAFDDEFRRKRRIVNRSWGAVRRHIGLFSWHRHARFLFMLVSHKVVRWFSAVLTGVALASGGVLALQHPWPGYAVLWALVVASVAVALAGYALDRAGRDMPKLVYLVYYFHLVGLASVLGIADELRGRRVTVWASAR